MIISQLSSSDFSDISVVVAVVVVVVVTVVIHLVVESSMPSMLAMVMAAVIVTAVLLVDYSTSTSVTITASSCGGIGTGYIQAKWFCELLFSLLHL